MSALARASIALLLMSAALACPALATPGDLDPSFSRDGYLSRELGNRSVAEAVAIDGRSRILVAATIQSPRRSSASVLRLRPDGTRDRRFGRDGHVELGLELGREGAARDVALLADGRIMVGALGRDGFAVVRLLPNGRPDRSFSRDGIAKIQLEAARDLAGVLPTAGGSMFVVGTTREPGFRGPSAIMLARLTRSGVLDDSYSGDGLESFHFGGTESSLAVSVAAGPGGSFLVAGAGYLASAGEDRAAVARFSAEGAPDPSLSDDGTMLLEAFESAEEVRDVVIDGQGRILLATCCAPGLVRLLPGGEPDPSFDATIAPLDVFEADQVAADRADRPVVVENVSACVARDCFDADYVIGRRKESGAADKRFGERGFVGQSFLRRNDFAHDVAIDERNRIVIVGSSADELLIARHESRRGQPDADGDRRPDGEDRCPGRYGRARDGCPWFARTLSFELRRAADRFTGRLSSREEACVISRSVEVRRQERGFDKILSEVRTDSRGQWTSAAVLDPGVYYAVADADFRPAVGRCGKARSNEIRIR